MNLAHQNHALWIWNSIPHLVLWGFLFLHIAVLGYSGYFTAIMPPLPLAIGLLWSWEWRKPSLGISLVLAGLAMDIFSGQPLGFNGLLWGASYMALPLFVHHFNADTPFVNRWLPTALVLGFFLIAERILLSMYDIPTPPLSTVLIRLLLLFSLMPILSWLIARIKNIFYRKLWAKLPEEIRIGA